MPLYECVLIARNEVTQQQVEAVADAIAAQLEAEGGSGSQARILGPAQPGLPDQEEPQGPLHAARPGREPAGVTEMERQLAPQRGRAALHDHPRRRRSTRRPPPSSRASPTTASAASAGRSPPAASTAGRRAATTIARNSAPARSSAPARRDEVRGRDRGVSRHVRYHRRQSGRPPRRRWRPPPVLPPPQVLPVLRPQRAEDRLQGRAPAVPLPVASAARSCPAASPRSRPRSSASWPRPSSAPASSPCCPTS